MASEKTMWETGNSASAVECVTVDSSDLELQQYLFDLQGYLVFENVLDKATLAELNQLIDAQQHRRVPCHL